MSRDFSARHVATAMTLGFGVGEKRRRAVEGAICNQRVIVVFKNRIHTTGFFTDLGLTGKNYF